jgi:NAD+ kinase
MFDPSSPYRRKSSLVTSDVSAPLLRRNNQSKTQCLVHQFLETQRRARNAHRSGTTGGDGHMSRSTSDHADGVRKPHKSKSAPPPPLSHAEDATTELGLDRVLDPKGGSDKSSRSQSQARPPPPQNHGGGVHAALGLDGGASPSEPEEEEIGQIDEKHWTADITAPRRDRLPPSGTPPATSEADELHSRLLTKKQLSEMAWGVRELSRRLGSVRLKFRARNIFLLTKIYDQDLIPKTRELAAWLLSPERGVKYVVYVERELRDNKKFDAKGLVEEVSGKYREAGEEIEAEEVGKRLRCWDENMCRTRPHTFDFVITLGGDGTVLYASWLFQRIVPPVLSFSLGSLGFLTKFDFEEYQSTLTTAFNDGVTVSLRLRFEGTIMRSKRRAVEDGTEVDEEEATERQRRRDLVEELVGEEQEDEHTHRPDGTYEILNEIVVDRGPNPSEFLSICGRCDILD